MLKRQAKTLNPAQIRALLHHVSQSQHAIRNRAIVLLSVRAGLRAKEIALLKWSMVCDSEMKIDEVIRLTDDASKGKSGGIIPMAKELRDALGELASTIDVHPASRVIQTSRSAETCPQVIVNMFQEWFKALGYDGCSSHSGRRTFITNAARNIGRFGGSLRDVQALARHSSLAMTQTYIEVDTEAMWKVVNC
jgi:integrase/recombinase XerD